jgi:hypothetical protein
MGRVYSKIGGEEELVRKPEGKRPLGRPRRRWVDNIKMDLRAMRWEAVGAGVFYTVRPEAL